jgi:hypothetical protein
MDRRPSGKESGFGDHWDARSRAFPGRAAKLIRHVMLMLLLGVLPAMAQDATAKDSASPAVAVPLGNLVQAIQDALSNARRYNDQAPYFLVKRIKLDLSVTRTTSAQAGVQFEIPVLPVKAKVGGEVKDENVETVSMTMKPAPQTLVSAAERINLAELLQAVKKAAPAQAGSGAITVTELTYATRFYLQATADGGIDFALFKGGADVSKAVSQRVEFELCQTIDLLDCVQ